MDHERFMKLAYGVRDKHANCTGRICGAIIIDLWNWHMVGGWNGTITPVKCTDGGCFRCNNKDRYAAGEGYGDCACIHAEQMAIANASKRGICTADTYMYCTLKPCLTCLKIVIASGISALYYRESWEFDSTELEQQYCRVADLLLEFKQV